MLTRDLLSESRRTEFVVDWVHSFDDALTSVAHERHDVVLVDYRLGEQDGIELIRQARSMDIDAPLILLTGRREKK